MSDTKTMTGKVEKSEAEWRKELTPMQYAVLREKATERPFSGEYEHEHRQGTYTCAGCGQTLFESDAKFDSGCGWPSFTAPAVDSHVDEERDVSHGMVRTEVLCSASTFLVPRTRKTWMAGHRRAEATPSFGRLGPAMTADRL